jgi:hypothetical protein
MNPTELPADLPSVYTILKRETFTDEHLSTAWDRNMKEGRHIAIATNGWSLARGLEAHVNAGGKLPASMYTDTFKMMLQGELDQWAMERRGGVVHLLDTLHKNGGTLNMESLLDKTFCEPLTCTFSKDCASFSLLAMKADLPVHVRDNLIALVLRLLDDKHTDYACIVLCNACFWGNETVAVPIYKRLKELEDELGINVDETVHSGELKGPSKRARVEGPCLSYNAKIYPKPALCRDEGLTTVRTKVDAKVGDKRPRS